MIRGTEFFRALHKQANQNQGYLVDEAEKKIL